MSEKLNLGRQEKNWLASNEDKASLILDEWNKTDKSEEVKEFFKKAIEMSLTNPDVEFDILPRIISNNLIDYTNDIKKMTAYLKIRGSRELGEYIESLQPHFNSFSVGEVKDIYKLVRRQYLALKGKYMMAIFSPSNLSDIFFIVDYGLTSASLKTYQKLLSKIPNNYIVRGAKLEIFVKQVGLMGVRGPRNFVRIVTTANPVKKATSLFEKLTKNAISKTTKPNGKIIANMGNNNYITYRTLGSSSSGYEATIDLSFSKIWAKTRKVKFEKP